MTSWQLPHFGAFEEVALPQNGQGMFTPSWVISTQGCSVVLASV
jgi:hypothetical protein